jgi:cysteine desulfurase
MALKFPIYMDNHATTPLDKRVLEAMLPYFTQDFGNAASRTHAYGWHAEAAVEDARETIADYIGAESGKEIVFTSGATESDNLAIKGVAEYYKGKGNHIITTTIEHKAVLDSCKRLEKEGYSVTYVNAGPDGLVNPADIEAAITDKTI